MWKGDAVNLWEKKTLLAESAKCLTNEGRNKSLFSSKLTVGDCNGGSNSTKEPGVWGHRLDRLAVYQILHVQGHHGSWLFDRVIVN